MNPSDLTGRELDLAVARALGYVWWTGWDAHGNPGVSYLRPDESPPDGWQRIAVPGLDYGSPWLPGYDCDGGRIPELFAEIAARVPMSMVVLARLHDGTWLAQVVQAFVVHERRGSTPNEALARLLLMVTER